MNKYETLVKILDVLRKEAPESYKFYHPVESNTTKLNQARARAYIHLFLKVKFGLLTFEERIKYVTDGTEDAGIDGYYIHEEEKRIYFIQSKFRDNKNNFEKREIKYEELLSMDIDRITEGEVKYESGISYNSKIMNFIKELSSIGDIARYKYEVVIIANTKDVSQNKLKKLSDGNPVSEYNFKRAYNELVFPIVSGTFYNQSELKIQLNLNNKNSEDISYSVETEFKDCDISVIFVPTIEIAKAMYKYKNTILKYNPRSYLDMTKGSINEEIAKTITTKKTNEFALFNNGITILSDSTDLNKKIGKKGVGQLIITNPQIINGGQTAYTLSRIYEDILNNRQDDTIFDNKEVLFKIITFSSDDSVENKKEEEARKLRLIEAISKATNQQTVVSEADRRSNDKIQLDLQKLIFDEYGLFYQRKSGEFGEGLRNKYIGRDKIIDRELLLRLSLASSGKPSQARRTGGNTLFKKPNFGKVLNNAGDFKKYVFAFYLYKELNLIQATFKNSPNNRDGIINYGYSLRYGKFSVIAAIMKNYIKYKDAPIKDTAINTLSKWLAFESEIITKNINTRYFRQITDENTGGIQKVLNFDGYYKGTTLNDQINVFFSNEE